MAFYRRAGVDRMERALTREEWLKVKVLKSITFVYEAREDRVLAAINSGKPEAWSCWLTRRLALVLLERAVNLLASTSALPTIRIVTSAWPPFRLPLTARL